jgi:hypothetical protein
MGEREGAGGPPAGRAGRWGGGLVRRVKVPPLPWLGGAGPVAWRQLSTAARRSGGLVFLMLLSAGVFATFFVMGRRGANVTVAIFPAVIWFTILILATLKFDFRGDLDQMPWLKSLPLNPSAVVAGQIVTPALLLAACHLAIFGAAAAMLPETRVPALAAAVLAAPFDLLLVAIENLLFLLFPTRGTATPGEIGAMGRQVVLFVVKILALALACGIATGFGLLAGKLTHSTATALAVTFCALVAEGLALVPLVALAYQRFDPSTDTPP